MMDNLFVHQLVGGWLLIYMDDMLIATDNDTILHIDCNLSKFFVIMTSISNPKNANSSKTESNF